MDRGWLDTAEEGSGAFMIDLMMAGRAATLPSY
jgi:hypothetical protein